MPRPATAAPAATAAAEAGANEGTQQPATPDESWDAEALDPALMEVEPQPRVEDDGCEGCGLFDDEGMGLPPYF